MSSLFLSAALMGLALVTGADAASDKPVTKEATPVEAAPAAPQAQPGDTTPLPNMDLPAKTEQGTPVPPQTTTTTETPPAAAAESTPAAPTETEKATPTAAAPSTAATSEEMTRPTENKNRSGKRVAAFWFITTGK